MELPQKTGQWRLLLNAAVNVTYSGHIKRGKLLRQVRYCSLLKDILLHGARDKYCLPASQLLEQRYLESKPEYCMKCDTN
jgi:hypothetical protein